MTKLGLAGDKGAMLQSSTPQAKINTLHSHSTTPDWRPWWIFSIVKAACSGSPTATQGRHAEDLYGCLTYYSVPGVTAFFIYCFTFIQNEK